MASIETLFKITASVSGTDAVKQLNAEVQRVSSGGETVSRAFSRAGQAVKAFVAAAAAREMVQFVNTQINLGDTLNDLSQRTGAAVESLAKYKVAADNSGTSIEELASGLVKLSRSQVAAQEGTGRQAAAFRALGVNIRDASGSLKNSDMLIGEIADKFAGFEDGAIKSALATELFGKSGANLIPFLNQGKEGIEQFSLAIDTSFARAADGFNDRLGIIGAQISNFGISAAKTMLPALTSIADAFIELFSKQGNLEGFFQAVGEGLKAVAALAIGLVSSIRLLISTISALVDSAKLLKDRTSGLLTGMDMSNGSSFEQIMADYNKRNADILSGAGSAVDKLYSPVAANDNEITVTGRSGRTPNFNPASDAKQGQIEKNLDQLQKWIVKQRESVETLRQEIDYIGMGAVEVEKLKDARKLDAEFAEKSVNLSPQQREKYRQEIELIKQQRGELIQLKDAQERSFGAGARDFLRDYARTATDSAAQIKQVFGTAFKGMEDALTEFVTTGKLNFRSLAQSIISDLARIYVQRQILGPLANGLGSLFGGFSQSVGFATVGGYGPFPGFASGGMHSGGYRVVGENGPELEATGAARIYSADQTRRILSGGGETVNVTVNMGGGDSVQGSGKGAELGRVIAAAVKATLIDEKRPGGLLAA